jgi:PPK2 family polyphosphate:nucleotide phosphotransferase
VASKNEGEIEKALKVEPGKKVHIKDWDPNDTLDVKDKDESEEILEGNALRLAELQYLLYAENKQAVLVVLQGMDGSGKDGTIRHVMSRINPQGCSVTGFKAPSVQEAGHDFLWRIHHAVPRRGEIGIFNRSHYEDVLVVRVHDLVPKWIWSKRYDQINAFEKLLSENNVKILKFFLHISKEKQKEKFIERLEDPKEHWKFNPEDLEKRKLWGEYMEAYEDILERCSTPWAPWFVIPSDKKWFRNLAVSQILVKALEGLNMKFPVSPFDLSKIKID